MSEHVITVTDNDFEAKVLKASKPTLVDFWAEWCGPCRALAPVVEQAAAKHEGALQVAKLNIDEHPETAGHYAVRAIPTLLLFKDGKVVEQVVGLVSAAKLESLLTKHL